MHLEPQLNYRDWVLFKTWKISTQICCYASTFIIISSVSSFLCSYMLLSATFGHFHQSFSYMFYKTSLNQVTNFVQLQKNLSTDYFNDKMDKILQMNSIFHFAQQESFTIQQPFECFDEPQLLNNIKLTSSVFCGGHTNKEVPKSGGIDKEYFQKMTSLMTEVYMMYNLRQPFYTSLTDDAYFGIIDFIKRPSSAKPQSIHVKQWYQDHINYMKSGQLILQSSPYFSGDKVVSFALSTNLTSQNGTMIGVGAQNQDLRLIPTFSKTNIKFSMVNSQDQLIISPLYVKGQTEIYNITQEELTGIGSNLWNQWKSDIDQQHSYVITNIDNIQISIIKLESPLSYIILEIDHTEDLDAQQYLFNRIVSESNKLIQLIIVTFIGVITFVLGLQYISVRLMQRDIQDIMETTKLKVYMAYYIVNRNQVRVKTSNISFQLYQAYLRLNECLSENKKKNEQCQIMEDLEYPKQPTLFSLFIDDIWYNAQQLKNQPQKKYLRISLLSRQFWSKFRIKKNFINLGT